MRPLRVALLYNHEPSGHSQVATAIEEELRHRDARTQVFRMNLSDTVHPVMGPVVAKTYLKIATSLPALWDFLYDNDAVAEAAAGFLTLLRRTEGKRIRAFLREHRPDAVVATQALPCAVVSDEKKAGRLHLPLIGAVTDFAAHRYWVGEQVDAYLVGADDTRHALAKRGPEPDRIYVTGIPIKRAFAQPKTREAARRALRLDPGRPVILVSGGTRGLGEIETAVAALAKLRGRPEIVTSCGTNDSLYGRLRKLQVPGLHVHKRLGERMADAMAAADLFVGKAGGVTASEALALGLPMLLYSPLPGQEEANVKWLTKHGAALRVKDDAELVRAAQQLLADPEARERMSERARRYGRPDSAARAADIIQALVHKR